MLMFTQEDLDRHVDLISAARLQTERKRIADLLREKAEAHPQWTVHDLLKDLADSIDPPPADPQV
jgi:hypothetical protein